MTGDAEEALDVMQKVFLLLCECLHSNIHQLEYESSDPSDSAQIYDITHESVENMNAALCHLIACMKSSLVYGTRDWFNLEKDEYGFDVPERKEEIGVPGKRSPYLHEEEVGTSTIQKDLAAGDYGQFCKLLTDRMETEFQKPQYCETVEKLEELTQIPICEVFRKMSDVLESKLGTSSDGSDSHSHSH